MAKPFPIFSALTFMIATFFISSCDLVQPQTTQPDTKIVSESLPQGITYQKTKQDNFLFHIITINPRLFKFSIYQNTNKESALNIKKIHQNEKNILTFNGNFFDEKFQPIGLLISDSKTVSDFQKSELSNGIFVIDQNQQAKLINAPNFKKSDQNTWQFAIQNGPVLLDQKGQSTFNTDTGKTAARTVLAIDEEGNINLIINANNLLDDNHPSLYQMSKILSKENFLPGKKLHSALNLDGGPSTGFALSNYYFPELAIIQNAVMIKATNVN